MLNIFKKYSKNDKRIIVSGIIGNLIDSYDVVICIFLAQILAINFFPEDSMEKNLMSTFHIFFIGYMSRPIGSLIFGLFSDQIGRKKTLISSIVIVGIGTTMIGFIPSFQTIGIYSTILFLIFRIIQNFSAGGEYISSIVYLTENAGIKRRGFFGSWVAVGVNCGFLFASLMAFCTLYLIDLRIVPDWSWRIIFILTLIGTSFGAWIRYSLPESKEFILENAGDAKQNKWNIFKESLKFTIHYPYQCFAIFVITWLGVCITVSIFIYSPIHLSTVNHLSQHQAHGINSLSLLFLILLLPMFGKLSDYFDRVTLLTISAAIIAASSIPAFWYLSNGSYLEVMVSKLWMAIPCACFFSLAPVVIAETFPLKIRCTIIALIYQISSSLGSGLTPLIILYILHNTNINYSPGYFLLASAIIGIIGLFIVKKRSINYLSTIKSDSILLDFPTK